MYIYKVLVEDFSRTQSWAEGSERAPAGDCRRDPWRGRAEVSKRGV